MNLNAPHFFERLRIEHTNFRSAVTHVKQVAVGGQAPALSRIGKLAQQMKIARVINKSRTCFPGELKYLPSQASNAFSKKLWRQIHPLEDFSSFKTNFSQRWPPIQSGPFVEIAVFVNQPLCVGFRVMWVRFYDFVGVFRHRCSAGLFCGLGCKQRSSQNKNKTN